MYTVGPTHYAPHDSTYRAIGVKYRSITQPRVILRPLFPPVSVPYTAVRWPLPALFQYPGTRETRFLGPHAQAFLWKKRSKGDSNPCPRRRQINVKVLNYPLSYGIKYRPITLRARNALPLGIAVWTNNNPHRLEDCLLYLEMRK